jgi:hypothetical protein
VPVANDSGKRIANNKRMRGGNKNLKRVFYPNRHSQAYALGRSPGPSRIERGQRARDTPKPSSRWRVGGSTSCGRCCATELCSRPALRLDIFIEIPLWGFYEKAHSVKGQRGGLREATRDQPKPLRAPFLFALRLSQSKVARCSMGSIQAKALPFEPRPPMESGHTPLFAVALGL